MLEKGGLGSLVLDYFFWSVLMYIACRARRRVIAHRGREVVDGYNGLVQGLVFKSNSRPACYSSKSILVDHAEGLGADFPEWRKPCWHTIVLQDKGWTERMWQRPQCSPRRIRPLVLRCNDRGYILFLRLQQ